jgi:hypothetical protein
MDEIKLPLLDAPNALTHASILFEQQASGLFLPQWQEGTAGAAHVRTMGVAGSLETRTLTIGADTDCVTNKTAPVAAELLTCGSFDAEKKRCRITWHSEQGGVPFAAVAAVALNSSGDSDALIRLDYVDVSAGDTGDIDTQQRLISKDSPVIEYNLEGTASTIDRIDIVGWLADGTGAVPVYFLVEVW